MNQHMRPEPVPFYDLGSQRRRLGTSIDEAISRVTSHCLFINGPEVAVLEKALADFCGAKHVVSCASGTDALLMVLMAREVGRGDAVLCPSFTFCATGEAVALTGRRRCLSMSRKQPSIWMPARSGVASRRRSSAA